MALRSANITVMIQAARKAARHLVRDFGEVEHLQVSVKGPGDYVSAADRKSEQILRQELSRARPEEVGLSSARLARITETPTICPVPATASVSASPCAARPASRSATCPT